MFDFRIAYSGFVGLNVYLHQFYRTFARKLS